MVSGGTMAKAPALTGAEIDTVHGYNRGRRGRSRIKRAMRRRFRHGFDVGAVADSLEGV